MGKNAPIQALDPKLVRAFVAFHQLTEFQAALEKRRDDAGVPGYARGFNALLGRVRGLLEPAEPFVDAVAEVAPVPQDTEDDSEVVHSVLADVALLRGAVSAFLRMNLPTTDREDLGLS